MNVLFLIPYANFQYQAPWTPLGAMSIATYLHERGFHVSFYDRSFGRKRLKTLFRQYAPDVVCVTVSTTRVVDDAVFCCKAAKEAGLPVVCGGQFASVFYAQLLQEGCVDYITVGEGELCTYHLLRALQTGEDPANVKGIALMRDGKPFLTPPQPIADPAELPAIDFSLIDPSKYIHSYIYCNKLMYLYATKGCPCSCTFCTNPGFHCHSYRVRSIEDVIAEIKYLTSHYGVDGINFSDECWYIRKRDMQEFCRRLDEEDIHIVWGCEMRVDIYTEEDLQFMYDHGCRWITLGIESGDEEMLRRIKKMTTLEQIRYTVFACNRIGIAALSNFIIGYPDETPEQMQHTINLVKELHSGVSEVNIFTPMVGSELFDTLCEKGECSIPQDLEAAKDGLMGEYTSYRSRQIPYKELWVVYSYFMWQEFTKKSTGKSSSPFNVALTSIRETLLNIFRMHAKNLVRGLFLTAREFFRIFWYAHFYPGIRKKYNLYRN